MPSHLGSTLRILFSPQGTGHWSDNGTLPTSIATEVRGKFIPASISTDVKVSETDFPYLDYKEMIPNPLP